MKWFLVLFFSPSLWGIYFGNPLSPQLPIEGIFSDKEDFAQFRFGYIGDFLQPSVEGLSANLQLGSFGCALQHKVLIELIGGGSYIHTAKDEDNVLKKLYASGPFCYGARLQGILKTWGKFVLGFSAAAMTGRARCRYETVQGQAVTPPAKHLRFKTWQAGFGVARKNEKLVPYLGIKASNFRAKSDGQHFNAKQYVGGVVGGSIAAFAGFIIDVEARFFDENSVTLVAELIF